MRNWKTIRIEFLTTIPNKAKIPIKAGNERGVLLRAKITKTPAIDRGITNITIIAFLNELNWITIVRIISRKERIIASKIELTEF